MRTCFSLVAAVAAVTLVSSAAHAEDVVYHTGTPTSFFTPFNATTPAGTLYGDSGYFGGGSSPATNITRVTLGLATYSANAQAAGTVDLVFTFNDGDPSGLVFGPGTALYSTILTGVTLPAVDGSGPSNFLLDIPTPGVMTAGGYNNIGFSIGVQNYNYGGSFGFQSREAFNSLGFMTGNASRFDPGSGWSLFSFGPNFPSNSPNFVMTVYTPEPASLSAIASLGLLVARRRR